MLITRRSFGLGLASAGALTLYPALSHATTMRALSLDELIEFSERVCLGTPVHFNSDYFYVAGTRRIVTWTRIVQDENLFSPEVQRDELQVMTLGGKVGNLRQKVPGEAALTMGQRCVVFISPELSDGTRKVVGMAQGKFTLETGDRLEILRPSRALPHLIRSQKGTKGAPPPPAAIETLDGKTLSEVRALLRGRK